MFSEMYESDYYEMAGCHLEDTIRKNDYAEVLESLIKHMYGEEPLDPDWIEMNLEDLASYFGMRTPCGKIELKGRV